ncbi:hypothetical protein DRO33_01535 [Candidatus Bathyarchaeota archaeon]|nr:MAG: hypothetical protein DRO33_01535 [Candidatus Bathyarchaeota archaeon]
MLGDGGEAVVRIVICYPFLLTNDGDLTLLRVLLRKIPAYLPGAELVIFVWGPSGLLTGDACAVELHTLDEPRLPRGLLVLASRFLQALLFRLFNLLPADGVARAVALSDVAVVPARDMLAAGGVNRITGFFYALCWLALPGVMGKPTFVLASDLRPGAGLLRLLLTPLLALVLRRVDLFTARDGISLKNLIEIGYPASRARLAADLGFLLEPAGLDEALSTLEAEGIPLDRRPLVGLSIHPLIYRAGDPEGSPRPRG